MIREYFDRSSTLLDSVFGTPEQLARANEARMRREFEEADAQEEARLREAEDARWARQIRRWASKHHRTA
jgi:hypothetical protein